MIDENLFCKKMRGIKKEYRMFPVLFFCFLMVAENIWGQNVSLRVDGFPAAVAWEERTFYVPISKSSPETLTVRLEFAPTMCYRWGGEKKKLLASEEQVLVENWHDVHFVSIPALGDDSLWQVVFTTLPVVSVKSERPILSSLTDTPCEIAVVSPDNMTDGNAVFQSKALAHLRGSSSLRYPKKSYSITLTDSLGEKLDANVMGIRSDSKWIIDGMGADLSRMRNRVCFDVWNDMTNGRMGNKKMRRNGTEGYFVEFVLNGRYQGLCCFSDKINRSLLGLTKISGATNTPRGLLYKCMSGDYPSHFLLKDDTQTASMDGVRWYDWELKYPDDYPSVETWRPLTELIDFTSLTKTNYQYVINHFDEYFYVENVVDYCVFLFALMLNDNMMHNAYLSVFDCRNDKRVWFTPWDLDASFGRNGWSGIVASTSKAWIVCQSTEPFRSFMDDTESPFFQAVCKRWAELNNTIFSPKKMEQRIRKYAELFVQSGVWSREVGLWNGKIVTPDNVTIYLSDTPETEVDFMLEWYERNYQMMKEMFQYERFVPVNIEQEYNEEMPNVYFDLQGRKLHQKPERGIYICDGKKYVIIK